jgi:uncharacterized membrane protein
VSALVGWRTYIGRWIRLCLRRRAGLHTLTDAEVLERLLALNHERTGKNKL